MQKRKIFTVALTLFLALALMAACTTDEPIGDQVEEEMSYYSGEVDNALDLQRALDEGVEEITLLDDIEADEITAESEFIIQGDGHKIDGVFAVDVGSDSAEFADVDNITEIEVESVGANSLTLRDTNARRLNVRAGAQGASVFYEGRSSTGMFYSETSTTVTVSEDSSPGQVVAENKDDIDSEDIEPEDISNPGQTSGYVTDSRGGPGLAEATVTAKDGETELNETTTDEEGYFELEVPADVSLNLVVEKEDRAQTLAQGVVGLAEEEAENKIYELPNRQNFNPDWPTTAPEIEVSGVEPGDVVSEDLEIEFDIAGERSIEVYYVNFGGRQRGPREAFETGVDEGEVTIDTTKHLNGESFLRLLAYDENDNAVMKFVPVVVDNEEPEEGEPPADLTQLGLTSISYGQNFGYFSEKLSEIEDEVDEDLARDITAEQYETPQGEIIDLTEIPADSTLYVEVNWLSVPGADGYSVYRSFDGEEFQHLGNITEYTEDDETGEELGQYNDYSPELSQRETHYKVVPYNQFGEGEAITRSITPLAPYNVVPETPEHEATEVELEPTLEWALDVKGEWPEEVMFMHGVSLFEATESLVIDEPVENALQLDLAELDYELDANTVYSWDVYYGEAFTVEQDEQGSSQAISIAGDGAGSIEGEYMFTTKVPENDTPEKVEKILDYDHLYDDSDQESLLVKSSDLDNLDDLLEELDSTVETRWEEIDWAKITVPEGKDLARFREKVQQQEGILLTQPNLPQEMPYHERVSEAEIESVAESSRGDIESHPDLGAEDYEEYLWGMENINASEAWETTTGGDEVVVAIVDTGVDMDHPEFAENEFVAPLNATGDDGPEAYDLNGHGTHVAGTAVADGRTGNIVGVSWDNPIMPIRVMDEEGYIYSEYTIEGILHMVDYMQENDQRVLANYSIGGRGYDAAMKDALDYAMDEGLVWVTSAGNDGKRVPNLPASYNGLISVAASTPRDVETDFSTSGFWNSVAAPGEKIWSTYPTYIEEEEYTYMQGTSMSSPHVTGAVALLLSENPELSPLEVLNQVEKTARGDGFSEELGHGILDVDSLLDEIEPVNYGSLQVNTDLPGAKLTVFDASDNLVGFAAVGFELERMIHALEPGDYTVKLTYVAEEEEENNQNLENDNLLEPGESITITEQVSVASEDVEEVDLMFMEE